MNRYLTFNDLESFTDNLRKQRHISALTRIKINRVRNIRNYLWHYNLINANLGITDALIQLRSYASNDVFLRKSISDATMGATPSDARFIREGDPRTDPYEEGYTLLDDMDLETIDMLIEFSHIIQMTLVHADAQQKEREAAKFAYEELWQKDMNNMLIPQSVPSNIRGRKPEFLIIDDEIPLLEPDTPMPNWKQTIFSKLLGKKK